MLDIKRFLASTIKMLDKVAGIICLKGLGVPEKIFCTLSSPWYVSQTRVIRMERNVPFIFTAKLADSLVKKEIDIFKEEYMSKYDSLGHSVRAIELKNIKTSLNGYETPEPLGKEAKELEMSLFFSIGSEDVLTKIEAAIGKHFHHKEIKFFSSTLATFAVIRDLYAYEDNFLLMDIGGEVTSIAMIKKNILREAISFPLGSHFIIRTIAEKLSISLPEAESLLSLYKDAHSAPQAAQDVGPIIEAARAEWLKKFQESLVNMSSDISIPSSIYLSVQKDLMEFFSNTIKSEQFNQYTLTDSKFKITVLETSLFHSLATFGDEAIREPDLIISAIYMNRFLNK